MHAVVSLFDEHTTQAVKNLWTELAADFGIRQLADVLPYPHFSYQIARHYDEVRLTHLVEQLVHQATPFPLQTAGLASFTGSHPVLYVPIVRTIELSHFHQRVWQAISPIGEGIPSHYEPNSWVPHITLAEHDIQAESLARIMARFFTRELLWEIPIDNLAIIWDNGTRQELRYQFHFQQRGKLKAVRCT
jgi:2'-5' RNA ligase